VTGEPLIGPLAPDCAERRRTLIELDVPPVWSLDPAVAVQLSREGNAATAAAWEPSLDSLPVHSTDFAADESHVALRWYRHTQPAGARAVIMWLHGGGWVLGDLATTDATARTACALTGADVVSVDYRCAPAARFPAAVDDAMAAADWLLAQGRRVLVAGDSAGANLAAVVALERASHPGLLGQVLVYPATDPELASESAQEMTEGPFLARRDMEWFYDQYLTSAADRQDPRVNLQARALPAAIAAVPAVVLTVGHDPLRDEGIAYASQLAAQGCDVRWIHAPELFHGAFSQSGVLRSGDRRVRQVWSAVQGILT
jgi:acetyl esterase